MSGRAAHDALLGLLTDGPARASFLAGGAPPEALAAATFDRDRLVRMARFLGRHFYRERIVRLCREVRALRTWTGVDPVSVVDAADFPAFVDRSVLGSPEAADEIASRVERRLLAARAAEIPYWSDLVRYDVARIRVEGGGGERRLDLAWDLPPLLRALSTEPAGIPVAQPKPTTLVVYREPDGRVSTALVA